MNHSFADCQNRKPCISVNHPWVNGGAGYKPATRSQQVYSQSVKNYQVMMARCKKESSCEHKIDFRNKNPNSFAYGWHCGLGRGGNDANGKSKPILSPVDWACKMHDKPLWSKNATVNWCGLHHALACYGEKPLFAWSELFRNANTARLGVISAALFLGKACKFRGLLVCR